MPPAEPADRLPAAPLRAVLPPVEQQRVVRRRTRAPRQADARRAAPPSAAAPPPVPPVSGLAICRTTTRAQTPRLETATPAAAVLARAAASQPRTALDRQPYRRRSSAPLRCHICNRRAH